MRAIHCDVIEMKAKPISLDGTAETEDNEDPSAISSRSLVSFLFPTSSMDDNDDHAHDSEPISNNH